MASIDDAEKISLQTRAEWRAWLQEHHDKQDAVWLVHHKKGSGLPRISWAESVEEALCFGWIDGRARSMDDDRYMQFFSKRKPRGTWSKINKESVARLIKQGLMTEAGLAAIETAKRNGAWELLDEVEELVVPEDLAAALKKVSGAAEAFDSLSRSVRRMALYGLLAAKRPETRQKRIDEILAQVAAKMRPKG